MKTEIQGDFIGYVKRFKLPTAKCFSLPLKSALVIFLVTLISSCGLWLFNAPKSGALFLIVECLAIVVFYIKILYKDFWNIVLEESKGLLPDIMMWIYYFAICIISMAPAIAFFVIFK